MLEGWILIHRKLQESQIWANDQPFDMRSAWIDLLMLANHADVETVVDYKPFVVKRGQYLTSVRKLSARWSWSKDRTLKYLRLLKSLGMIEKDSNNQRTLLTIVNYEVYQDWQDMKRTRTRTRVGHERDTGSPQTNNEKNENNENKYRFVPPTVDDVRAYCQEKGFMDTVNPNKFVDFYESKGWMVGKNKMKDWKAAVRNWASKEPTKTVKKNSFGDFAQRKYNFDDLEKEMKA